MTNKEIETKYIIKKIRTKKDDKLWHGTILCKHCGCEIEPVGTYDYTSKSYCSTIEKFSQYLDEGVPNYCSNCGAKLKDKQESSSEGISYNTIIEHIQEARQEALRKGISANMVILNDTLAYTKRFRVHFGNYCVEELPPTILGLEVKYNTLPDNIQFILGEGKTERDKLVQQAKQEAVKEFARKFKRDMYRKMIILLKGETSPDLYSDDIEAIIDNLLKEYEKESYATTIKNL